MNSYPSFIVGLLLLLTPLVSSALEPLRLLRSEVVGEARVATRAEEVESEADLREYAQSLLLEDEALEELRLDSSAVEMWYRQRGRFLALVPVNFLVVAKASADGAVSLHYPWYSFLTVDNDREVETELRVAVDNALREKTVGRVTAEGEPAVREFGPAESALVAHRMQKVLKTYLRAQAELGESATSTQ